VVAVNIVRFAHHLDDALCKGGCIRWLGDADLHDRKFVAPHAGDGIGIPHKPTQPFSYHFEQLVADRMAEGIVDILEVVEIEKMGGHDLATLDAGQGVLQVFIEQCAIWETGQGIVQGHVRDLGLRAALLGYVLMGRDSAAVRHRLYGNCDAPAVAQLAVKRLKTDVIAAAKHGPPRFRPSIFQTGARCLFDFE